MGMSLWSAVLLVLLLSVSFCDARPKAEGGDEEREDAKDALKLPPLPKCNDDTSIFAEMWRKYVVDIHKGPQECSSSEKLLVLVPTNKKFLELGPGVIFRTDDELGHKILEKHTFYYTEPLDFDTIEGDVTQILEPLKGDPVTVDHQKGGNEHLVVSIRGHRVTRCIPPVENSCVIAYNFDGVLGVTEEDVEAAIEKRRSSFAQLDYPIVRLPRLTSKVRDILEHQLSGSKFAQMWTALLTMRGTLPEDYDGEMMIMVPTDEALEAMIPELLDEVKDPLTNDMPLVRHIITNHISVREGIVPQAIFERLPEDEEIIKSTIGFENLVFHREVIDDTNVIKVNGVEMGKEVTTEKVSVRQIENVLFPNTQLVEAAILRMAETAEVDNPFFVPDASDYTRTVDHAATAKIPTLESRVSFGLRQLGAARFASVWLDLKMQSQLKEAELTKDHCSLPKDTGPCRLQIGRFFFNIDAGKCEPFVWGGCAGNENRFTSLYDCAQKCIKNTAVKEEVRDQICQLPVHKFEGIKSRKLREGCGEDEAGEYYHFNVDTRQCEIVSYMGCFSTDNLFKSMEECSSFCQGFGEKVPTVETPIDPICHLEPTTKSSLDCFALLPKWTYKIQKKRCIPYLYSGCGGTENLFDTEADCAEKCPTVPPEHLYIWAPQDEVVEEALATAGGTSDVFLKDELLGRLFLFGSLSLEECSDDIDSIQTYDGEIRDCAVLLGHVTGKRLEGIGYTINVVDTMPVTANDISLAKQSQSSQEIVPRSKTAFVPFGSKAAARAYVDTTVVPESEKLPFLLAEARVALSNVIWETTQQLVSAEAQSYTISNICQLPLEHGTGIGKEKRYFYNPDIGACVSFTYAGQGGNTNNFHSYNECSAICGAFKGKVAVAKLVSPSGVSGVLTLTQVDADSQLIIMGRISGLEPGKHGFHIHDKADLSDNCKAAGGHYNPHDKKHGSPDSSVRHVGDLGNIEADSDGVAMVDIRDSLATMYGEFSILNRPFVVHAGEDDLGTGEDEGSMSTGNAGGRVACGLIKEDMNKKTAMVTLIGRDNVKGTVMFQQDGPYSPVQITGEIYNLEDGHHGFHIHEHGDTSDGCKASGGHFNPEKVNHGGPSDEERHVGDLGNIHTAGAVTTIDMEDSVISLYSWASIVDRTVVIHSNKDDLGKKDNEGSLKTGNAGSRVACGLVIEGKKWPVRAVAILRGQDKVKGKIELFQSGPTKPVRMSGKLIGLSAGKHGFHVHEKGSTGNVCKSAGGHFNPNDHPHSSPESSKRHVGDLGNIIVGENHAAAINVLDSVVSLYGPHSILGRTIVVHAGEDDLGLGDNEESAKTGNAGARVACGIIQTEEEAQKVVSADAYVVGPEVNGKINLVQEGANDFVHVEGNLFGLKPGKHGFHVHDKGSTSDMCKAAGPHFNPFEDSHGDPHGDERHAGDLGNILTSRTGTTFIDLYDSVLTLRGEHTAIGRTIVVHEDEDDLGMGDDEESSKTGNAGARLACGVIKRSKARMPSFCKLPPVREGTCLTTKPAWTYDASRSKCIRYSHGGCAIATANRFDTEQECRDVCPVIDDGLIILAPNDKAVQKLLEERGKLSHHEMRQFVICHVIRDKYDASSDSQHETLCGQAIHLEHKEDKLFVNDMEADRIITKEGITVIVIPRVLSFGQ